MTRKCLIIICLIGIGSLLLPSGCQQQNQPPQESVATLEEPLVNVEVAPKPVEASPKITFDKAVVDFGEVGPNTKKTGEITFSNDGDATLKITKIPSCCGVQTSLAKMEYAPGEKGTMAVMRLPEKSTAFDGAVKARQITTSTAMPTTSL